MVKLKLKSKAKIILLAIIAVILFVALLLLIYINVHGISSKLKINLKGKNNIKLEVNNEYKEEGAVATYYKNNLSKKIKVTGKVDNKKLGKYKIIYTIKYKKIKKKIIRTVSIVDTIKPEIKLTGDEVNIYLGNDYAEPGFVASDNYDGDITSKVKVENNIDKDKLGEYEVTYSVEDSSKNKFEIKRKVKVIEKPKVVKNQKIAVLNYHFFYDEDKGEFCGENICERTSDFRAHLNYLRDNGYKTLTMKEFRDWMYGEIEIPDKSVLITVDDGAYGTGKHNGNHLITILEEYKMHATLFLITGWWGIENYQSKYLDVESHTHDMHHGNVCANGADILCHDDQYILNDLNKSIEITKSKTAFCFPFYGYSAHAIDLVKQVGFELAFIGGNKKVSRDTDKYHITRYPIYKNTSLQTFINYVS